MSLIRLFYSEDFFPMPRYQRIKNRIMNLKLLIAGLICILSISCSKQVVEEAEPVVSDDPMQNKGLGPISSVELGDLSEGMVKEGEAIFNVKCTACHKMDKRYIGPSLVGVTERRTPEWIMNMILNPDEMVMKDPLARQLLMEYSAPMANQSLTEPEARKLLEYFRANKEPTTSIQES